MVRSCSSRRLRKAGQAQRLLLAAELLHLGDESVRFEVDGVLQLRVRLGDFVLDLEPVENIPPCSLADWSQRR